MIREIQPEDIPNIMPMCVAMHAESEYRNDGFSHDKMEDLLDRTQMPNLLGLVSVHDNEITGMFIGTLTEHFFSHNTITCDLLLYVKPEYRGTRDGYQLIKGYLAWAEEVEADVVKMGITTGINEEKTRKLYEKLGFCYSGSIYKLRK